VRELWHNPVVTGGRKRWISRTLYALPLLTVGVVCFALFVVAAPRPYPGARLYGGATLGVEHVSFRVEAVERLQELEVALVTRPVRVEADFGSGQRVLWRGQLDALGMAHPRFRLAQPSRQQASVRVLFDDVVAPALVEGEVALSVQEWTKSARELGGWLNGRRTGPIQLDVAAARGLFAIPFQSPVLLRASREGRPIEGVALHVEGDGISLIEPKSGQTLRTSATGQATGSLRPREHVASLRVVAEGTNGERGTWFATLPVLPGALTARLQAGKLRVESPVERDAAFFMLTDQNARLASGSVRLEPDGRGGAVGEVLVPDFGSRPLWAVVSSEAQLNSPGAVGWPLTSATPDGEPPLTWTVADVLLLDGLGAGFARDQAHKARARLLAGGFSAGAAVLIILLLIGSVRSEDALLAERLSAAVPEAAHLAKPQRAWALVVAALCIALGFTVVALVAMYRI